MRKVADLWDGCLLTLLSRIVVEISLAYLCPPPPPCRSSLFVVTSQTWPAMYFGANLYYIWLLIAAYAILKLSQRVSYLWQRRANSCGEPPRYPHKDPIWGLDLFYAQKWAGENGVWLPTSKRLFKENGKTYKINLLGTPMIHTMDPKNIQAAWAINFKDWGLEPFRKGLAVPFFDKGINTTDGDFWHHSRSLIRPTFARTEVANFKSLEKHTDRFMTRIPWDGSTVDVQKLFSCLVGRTSCTLVVYY